MRLILVGEGEGGGEGYVPGKIFNFLDSTHIKTNLWRVSEGKRMNEEIL